MGYRDENFGLRIDSELKRDLERIADETRLSMSDLIHDCCYALLPTIDQHRLLWAQLQEHAKASGKPVHQLLLECIQNCIEHLHTLRESTRPAPPSSPGTTKYPPPKRKKK